MLLCWKRHVKAAVTIILPALWVTIQWCIKCRAVGRLDLPSYNTLHGLMPPLAGKWVRKGGGWGAEQYVCWRSIPALHPWNSELGRASSQLTLVRMSSSCRWTAESWVMLTQPESRNSVKGIVCFPEVWHSLIVPPKSTNPQSEWSSLSDQYGNVWKTQNIVPTLHSCSHNFTAIFLILHIFLSKFTIYIYIYVYVCVE